MPAAILKCQNKTVQVHSLERQKSIDINYEFLYNNEIVKVSLFSGRDKKSIMP
jgi:hypothetical protein